MRRRRRFTRKFKPRRFVRRRGRAGKARPIRIGYRY